ncbi:hypothetical protein S40293_04844 [Stachybotrys chartarum IBT 40293]|nr:hypothetical protein S40293_04844 [Stachybotrys chartarum IBT 40293]KFA74380.1 hypothetical protein S40288_03997 [Stachybotrys chartarum IBT 40288]
MVVEISASTPDAVQFRQVWRRPRGPPGDEKLHLSSISQHLHIPRCPPDAVVHNRQHPSMLADKRTKRPRYSVNPSPPQANTHFTFPLVPSASASPLAFAEGPPDRLWRGVKRRRHGQDVDGPNTAGLCCKKRRLRSELITSRLSQPFSLPATHILNREGMKSGDKRFFKIAASLDLARRIAHLHATSFLRFSLMNSLRRRLGLWKPGVPRQATSRLSDTGLDTTTKAPWQQREGGEASKSDTAGSPLAPSGAGRPPAAQGKPLPPVAKMPSCRLSIPAALPRPSGDAIAATRRTSPRIHPVRSPELRPMAIGADDLDEDSFAFLHADDDAAYDVTDDPEHVYSDFGVIFGGASSEPKSPDEHSYEEYLDELDGITWVMG